MSSYNAIGGKLINSFLLLFWPTIPEVAMVERKFRIFVQATPCSRISFTEKQIIGGRIYHNMDYKMQMLVL
jgi:hypothetical protein